MPWCGLALPSATGLTEITLMSRKNPMDHIFFRRILFSRFTWLVPRARAISLYKQMGWQAVLVVMADQYRAGVSEPDH